MFSVFSTALCISEQRIPGQVRMGGNVVSLRVRVVEALRRVQLDVFNITYV
jgi:hypothetical protein